MVFTFLATFGTIFSFIGRLIAVEFCKPASLFAPTAFSNQSISAIFFHPIPNELFICVPQNLPGFFKDVWIPLFAHEAILCILAVIKGVQNVQIYGKEGFRSRFTIFLVADSVQYYFAYVLPLPMPPLSSI